MIENEGKDVFDKLTRKSALIIAVCLLPLYFFIPDPAKATVACVCGFAIITAIWIRWDLSKQMWFWATAIVIVLVHIPLIFAIHWTNNDYPGIVLAPAALLDLGIVYLCIKLVEKIMKPHSSSPSQGADGEA